jgi:hypothetical protein
MQIHTLAIIFLFSIPALGMQGGPKNKLGYRPPTSGLGGFGVNYKKLDDPNFNKDSLGAGLGTIDFGENPFAKKLASKGKVPVVTEVRKGLPDVNIVTLDRPQPKVNQNPVDIFKFVPKKESDPSMNQPTKNLKPEIPSENPKDKPAVIPSGNFGQPKNGPIGTQVRFNYPPTYMNFYGMPPRFDIAPVIPYDPKYENSPIQKTPDYGFKDLTGKLPTSNAGTGPKVIDDHHKFTPFNPVQKSPAKDPKAPIIKADKRGEGPNGLDDFAFDPDFTPKNPFVGDKKVPKIDNKRPGGLGDLISGLTPESLIPGENDIDALLKSANIKPRVFTRSKSFSRETERPRRDEKKPFEDSDKDNYEDSFLDYSKLSFRNKSRGRRSSINSLALSRTIPRGSVVTLRSMSSLATSYARGDPPIKRVTRYFMIERMPCGRCLEDPFIKKMVDRAAN